MSFLIIQILSLAIYRQSSGNPLAILCQSPVNHLPIPWQSPGNPLPIPCQSCAKPLAILWRSPSNNLPIPWQSSAILLAILCQIGTHPSQFKAITWQSLVNNNLLTIHLQSYDNPMANPDNFLSIVTWQSSGNPWQWKREWQRNAKNFEIFGEKLFAKNAKCLRNNSYFSLETLLVFSKKKYL